MKKTRIFLIIAVLVSINVLEAAAQSTSESLRLQDRHRHHHRRPTIGAPLDGGLLVALGAAGAGYLMVRRRKKNNK